MIQIPISLEQLEQKKIELEKEDIHISEDSGEVSKQGVKVRYSYDGQTLTINVISKPFLVSTGYVEEKIKSWFI